MIQKSNKYITLIFFSLLLFSCNKDKENREKALKLNSLAVKNVYLSNDSITLNQSLKILDEAINLDKNLISAYTNKANIFLKLRKHKQALLTLDELLKIDIKHCESYLLKGLIMEKNNNIKEAKVNYLKAIEVCNERIRENPTEIDLKLYKISILLIIDKKEAIHQINDLEKKNPHEVKIDIMNQTISNFNKEDYLKSVF